MIKEVDIIRRALFPARLEPRAHPRVVLRGARHETSAMNGEGLELDDGAVAIDLRQFGELRQAERRELGARLGEARQRVSEGRGDGGVENSST